MNHPFLGFFDVDEIPLAMIKKPTKPLGFFRSGMIVTAFVTPIVDVDQPRKTAQSWMSTVLI